MSRLVTGALRVAGDPDAEPAPPPSNLASLPAGLVTDVTAIPAQGWSRGANGGLPRWRLARVLAYIDNNLGSDIRLDDLASVACLSAHHFSELFRQSMGTSPYRYVLDRRVECAKVLLRDSMLGVLEVALAVGFADQSHFSKVFRRATGMAPGAYRAAA
ncbi:MAG TPA: AraC family transcriptional regulator [Caulobacterales bacterium]|nr:AraC family transcriptional regulator [Caulobacterales bacterium]